MKNENQSDMKIPQPRLGKGGMIALITMCNVIAPLSTDMYMPALPDMAQFFHTTDAVMNMTLVGFFLVFALGMLMITSLWNDYILGLSMLCVITGVIGTVWSQLLRKTLSEDALTVPEE